MKNDTHLNILMSYAYMHGETRLLDYLKKETTAGVVNLMIDSGAFTKHNAKANMSHVNVDDYCEFLQDMAKYSEKYVMLDVVGQAEQSKKNYEHMLNVGLNPMFVATMFDKDYSYIRRAVDNNPDLCVAGGVTTKGDWLIKRFQDIYRQTNGKARMHGLGYFTFPRMLQLNLASIDASSWKTAPARFGQGIYFCDKRTYRISYHDVLSGHIKFTRSLTDKLDQHGITPRMFAQKKYHDGKYCFETIEGFMSIVCNVELQKYCKKHGLDYFLAVGGLEDLQHVVYVSENLNTVTYESYCKEFGKA